MSETKPFTEKVTKANRTAGGADTARWGWITAGVLAALLIAALLMWATAVGKLNGMRLLKAKLNDANAALAGALTDNDKDKEQINALQSQVADLQKEKD